MLERCGYRVLDAGSGPEAFENLGDRRQTEVDLLLTDVIMPAGITGRKLAEDLLEKKTSLKVIFQSGYGGDIMRDSTEFLRQTNSCFLQKPCAPRDLLRAVRRCLDGLPPCGGSFRRESLNLRAGFVRNKAELKQRGPQFPYGNCPLATRSPDAAPLTRGK